MSLLYFLCANFETIGMPPTKQRFSWTSTLLLIMMLTILRSLRMVSGREQVSKISRIGSMPCEATTTPLVSGLSKRICSNWSTISARTSSGWLSLRSKTSPSTRVHNRACLSRATLYSKSTSSNSSSNAANGSSSSSSSPSHEDEPLSLSVPRSDPEADSLGMDVGFDFRIGINCTGCAAVSPK